MANEPTNLGLDLPEQARCQHCGYQLRGLIDPRCPECGTPFDVQAIWAKFRPRERLPFDQTAARWLSPPSWWASGLATVAIVSNFPDCWLPVPPGNSYPSMWGVLLWGISLGMLLLRLCDRGEAFRRYQIPQQHRRIRGRNWIVLPILCMLFYPRPATEIAFILSKPQLDALATKVVRTRSYPPDRWIGLFPAEFISPTSDGMNFRIRGHHECGLAYTTTGQPPQRVANYTALGGGWYAFDGQ